MAVTYNEAKIPKINLKNIGSIKKEQEQKWGKKSAAYQVIRELEELNMSDIAIYAGMYLASIKQKPVWTIEDLKDILVRKDFIDDKLLPLLNRTKKFQSLPEPEKKAKALLIAQGIADGEAEVIQIVNTHLTANSKDVTLANQLTPGQLRQLLNMLNKIVDILNKIYDKNEPEIVNLMKSIIWYTDSKNTTNVWFNTLLRDFSGIVGLAIRDIKDMKRDKGISEKEFAVLNSLQKQFEGFSNELNEFEKLNVLWPESENDIKGLTGLKQYIAEVEAYRVKAKQVIDQYIKRKDKLMNVRSEDEEDNIAIQTAGWSDEKINAMIKKIIKDNYNLLAAADLAERAAFINEKSAELLNTQRGLNTYMSKTSHDPESVLAGMFGKMIVNPNVFMGRPENQEEIEQDYEQ